MSLRPSVLPVLVVALLVAGCGGSPPASTPGKSASASPSASPSPSYGAAGWTYLALGDSNVYGADTDCGSCTTYPHLLQKQLSDSSRTDVTLIDASQHNSLTSQMLLTELRDDHWGDNPDPLHDADLSPREAVAAADLITITVAANEIPWYQDDDPCLPSYDAACVRNFEKPFIDAMSGVLDEISTIRGGRATAVRVTTFYNDLLKGPGHDPAWFYDPEQISQATTSARAFLNTWNTDLCHVATAHGAACVDIYHRVNGPRGLRPLPEGFFSQRFGDLNQTGQDRFAAEIIRTGFAPLT